MKLWIFSTLLLFHLTVSGQGKGNRILILLDGSSSMMQEWSPGQTRFKTASNIILRLMDSIYQFNNEVEFALRVYGHQYPAQENNCYDTKQEVMFSRDNLTQMTLRLESLHPYGISPIAYSLKLAAEQDLVASDRYNYSIILITDGGESCKGNICKTADELLQKKIAFKPYIVSLVEHAPLIDQYSCLGRYLQTSDEKEVAFTIDTLSSAYKRIIPTISIRPKVVRPIENIIASRAYQINFEKLATAKYKQLMVLIEMPTFSKIVVPADTFYGFGYIKIANPGYANGVLLYYEENGKYISLDKLNFTNLIRGQRFRIQSGKYKIEYNRIPGGAHELQKSTASQIFIVKNEMITELNLK